MQVPETIFLPILDWPKIGAILILFQHCLSEGRIVLFVFGNLRLLYKDLLVFLVEFHELILSPVSIRAVDR